MNIHDDISLCRISGRHNQHVLSGRMTVGYLFWTLIDIAANLANGDPKHLTTPASEGRSINSSQLSIDAVGNMGRFFGSCVH